MGDVRVRSIVRHDMIGYWSSGVAIWNLIGTKRSRREMGQMASRLMGLGGNGIGRVCFFDDGMLVLVDRDIPNVLI